MKKIILIISAVFVSVLLGTGFLFFTESGRNFLITYAMKHFFQDRVTVSVSKVDPMVNNIGLITVKTIDGVSVRLENIEVNREGFFGIPYFKIKNVNLNFKSKPETFKQISQKDAFKNETSELQEKLNSTARLIPLFTSGVEIKNFDADINDKLYKFHDIKCLTEDKSMTLCSDQYGVFSIRLNLEMLKCPSVTIKFSKFYYTNGVLIIDDICSAHEKKFHLTAQHKFCDVDAFGNFINPEEKIIVSKCRVIKQGDRIDLAGIVYPSEKKVEARVPVELNNLPTVMKIVTKLPNKAANEVIGYLDKTILNASTKLEGDYTTKLSIEKNEKMIVSAKLTYLNPGVKVLADLYGIDVHGYKINALEANILEKRISAALLGKDFNIETTLNKENDDFKVSQFSVTSKFGKIKLKSPIDFPLNFLKKNFVSLEFDIKDFNFFCKAFADLQGEGRGQIEYNGVLNSFDLNALKIKMFSPKVSYDRFSGEKIDVDFAGNVCNISIDKLKLPQMVLKNLSGKIHHNNFDIKCLVREKNELTMRGKISNNLKNITITGGQINHGKKVLKFQNSTMDLANNSYSINGIFPEHKKMSSFQFELSSAKCKINFINVHLQDFAKIVGSHIHGLLNGSISLHNVNGIFQGQGNLSLLNVLTTNNLTDIAVNFQPNGVTLKSGLRKRDNVVNIDFFLPVVFNNNMEMKNTNAKLSAHVYGKNKLENFFELPDKSSLQGDFDCDCHVSGSFKNPQISGKISIENMIISVNSVLLSNGKLDLIGDGSRLLVQSARFTDNQKNTVTATGYGRVFFDNFSPNLDVNLDLDFKNFFVLNSDTTKVQVTGKGKMYGPIHDMKLSGDLQVPYAEISHFESEDDLEQTKIEYENDPLLAKKNEEEKKDSFFNFDVMLHCRKIKVGGKNFVLFLKGDLLLSMFEEQDTLVGDLNLTDGTLNLFGKRLKFVKGDVTFLRKYPYNPRANFLCRKNFGNMLVSVEIKNSVKEGASITLSSNPSYSQDVILSQMLFNKDTKSLSTGEAAQLVQAVSGLKNQGYLFSLLGAFTSTGLWDNISFSSDSGKYSSSLNTDTQTSTQQVNISAGKYLQDNVYVSLNKKNEKTTFDVDLAVSPSVSVKANTAGEVGLNWKYRY